MGFQLMWLEFSSPLRHDLSDGAVGLVGEAPPKLHLRVRYEPLDCITHPHPYHDEGSGQKSRQIFVLGFV